MSSIHSLTIKLCKVIWNITPFFRVRQLYLNLFMWCVRGKKIVRTVEGMTFNLDLAENIDVCILLEKFERDVVGIIDKYSREGWSVMDIGANMGAHTIRFANRVGVKGVVYAFEPTNYAYNKLVSNVSLNSPLKIHTYRVALWNENKNNQPITFRSSWQTNGTSVSSLCTADFVRLDDWCNKHNVRHVDMIKIDVDGNEFPVFDGGRELIERCRPLIIMEVAAYHFAGPDNPMSFLSTLGYRFWDIKTQKEYAGEEGVKNTLLSKDEEIDFSINLLATPNLPDVGSLSST